MLKARVGDNMILGLSHENVRRLKKGQPIRFAAKDLGFPGEITVYIFYGVTEADMERELEAAGFMRSMIVAPVTQA